MLKNGKKKSNEYFTVFTSVSDKNRLFTGSISKKILKKSVERNLYKRRIKTVFNRHKYAFKGMDVLIISRPGITKLKNYRDIEEKILLLAGKK